MTAIDRLIAGIARTGNPTCAGLDTQESHLPPHLHPGQGASLAAVAAGILKYNAALIEALRDIVPCVKVQVAYYEMLGLPGMAAFGETLRLARAAGYSVIADVKRGDIGATASAYAQSYLPAGAPFEADFITVNPYLGGDSVQPFVQSCGAHGKGVFVLVKTSNPGSGELQDRELQDGETLYSRVGGLVGAWGKPLMGEHGYSAVGAVVGATHPRQGAALRRALPGTFFLIPGYGAQGATTADLRGCFDERGGGGVVNASRSLLAAWQKKPDAPYLDAVRQEALRMREELAAACK